MSSIEMFNYRNKDYIYNPAHQRLYVVEVDGTFKERTAIEVNKTNNNIEFKSKFCEEHNETIPINGCLVYNDQSQAILLSDESWALIDYSKNIFTYDTINKETGKIITSMPYHFNSIVEYNGELTLEFNDESKNSVKGAKVARMQRAMPLADYKYFSKFAPSQLHSLGVQLSPDKTEQPKSKYESYFR